LVTPQEEKASQAKSKVNAKQAPQGSGWAEMARISAAVPAPAAPSATRATAASGWTAGPSAKSTKPSLADIQASEERARQAEARQMAEMLAQQHARAPVQVAAQTSMPSPSKAGWGTTVAGRSPKIMAAAPVPTPALSSALVESGNESDGENFWEYTASSKPKAVAE